MALALTDEQVQLTEAMAGFARRHGGLELTRSQFDALAAGERPAFWTALVSHALHAVQLPEQGGGFADAACVVDAAGYGLLPGPLLPTMIAAAVTADLSEQPAVRAVREALAAGGPMAVMLPASARLSSRPASTTFSSWEGARRKPSRARSMLTVMMCAS